MNDMFKKVNAREKLIGWYHSGPKLRVSDLEINELFKRYTPNPLLVIIDVQPKEVGVPTDAYFAVEEIKDVELPFHFCTGLIIHADHRKDGTTTSKTFMHTPSVIEAEEAEEIGVEHLLRDIRDVAVGTLSTRITSQLQSLQGLHLRLRDIGQYLQKVIDKELPVNHAILGNLQDVFNLLPNLSNPTATPSEAVGSERTENTELARAMSVKTNDQLMAIYLSSLIRAITAFHDLIENKIQNRQQQEEKEAKKEEEGKEKDSKKMNGLEGVNGVNGDSKEEEKEKGAKEKGKEADKKR